MPLDGDFRALFVNGYHSLAGTMVCHCSENVVTTSTKNRDLSPEIPSMRIATWNVNSVRQRLDHLLTWLKECSPDIVCLQEIKCVDEAFPRLSHRGARLQRRHPRPEDLQRRGAARRNYPFDETKSGLAGDDEDAHARFIEGVVTLKARGDADRLPLFAQRQPAGYRQISLQTQMDVPASELLEGAA